MLFAVDCNCVYYEVLCGPHELFLWESTGKVKYKKVTVETDQNSSLTRSLL